MTIDSLNDSMQLHYDNMTINTQNSQLISLINMNMKIMH